MNRHTKIAILIAPFLIIGGYIAADYYQQQQTKSRNIFKLSLQGSCDLTRNPCTLTDKQLTLTISNNNNTTKIITSHALEEVIISLVDKRNTEIRYIMKASKNQKLWQSETQISALLEQTPALKIRLISIINKAYYFSEFYSRKN